MDAPSQLTRNKLFLYEWLYCWSWGRCNPNNGVSCKHDGNFYEKCVLFKVWLLYSPFIIANLPTLLFSGFCPDAFAPWLEFGRPGPHSVYPILGWRQLRLGLRLSLWCWDIITGWGIMLRWRWCVDRQQRRGRGWCCLRDSVDVFQLIFQLSFCVLEN